MKLARLFYRLTVPGAIVLLLAFSLVRLGIVTATESRQIHLYPAIILAIGLVLSAAFHRSRLFLAFLVAGLARVALVVVAPRISPDAQRVLVNAIAFLVPLNLLAFSLLQDRGIISPAGERRLACIGLQVLLVGMLMLPRFARASGLLARQFAPLRFSNWSRIPQPALAAFLLVAVVIAVLLARRYSAVDSSLFWSAISIFIALRAGAASYQGAMYFGVTGVLLIVAVLETSYSMAFHTSLRGCPAAAH